MLCTDIKNFDILDKHFFVIFCFEVVRRVSNEVELEIIRTACSSYSCMAHRCS